MVMDSTQGKSSDGVVKPKLTVRQTKFVDEYIKNNGNGTQAYLKVYDTTNADTARAEAATTLAKPNVKEAVQLALESHGLTIESVTKPIADGIKAVRFQEVEGKLRALPDHAVRLNASWKALTLMGATANPDDGKGSVINFNFGTQNYIKSRDA